MLLLFALNENTNTLIALQIHCTSSQIQIDMSAIQVRADNTSTIHYKSNID